MKCPACDGDGLTMQSFPDGPQHVYVVVDGDYLDCYRCGGTGRVAPKQSLFLVTQPPLSRLVEPNVPEASQRFTTPRNRT